jgi:hypothetical protein
MIEDAARTWSSRPRGRGRAGTSTRTSTGDPEDVHGHEGTRTSTDSRSASAKTGPRTGRRQRSAARGDAQCCPRMLDGPSSSMRQRACSTARPRPCSSAHARITLCSSSFSCPCTSSRIAVLVLVRELRPSSCSVRPRGRFRGRARAPRGIDLRGPHTHSRHHFFGLGRLGSLSYEIASL